MISLHRFYRGFLIVLVACALCACSDKNKDNKSKTAADVSKTSKDAASKTVSTPADHLATATYTDEATGLKLGNVVARTIYSDESMAAINKVGPDIEAALKKADNGDVDGAITQLNVITGREPKAFIAYYDLALLYERQNNLSGARKALGDALKAEPKYTQALLELVRIDIRNGDSERALSTANHFLVQYPDVFSNNYAKLEAMIADRQYDETIAMARALLKKDEANARLRYYIAHAEFERGRYRLAEFIIGESLEIDPDDPEALFLKIRIHDALSTDDVSLVPGIASQLDHVLELNPDHFEALWMRGVIYYEASNYAKAEAYFRRMIDLNPRNVGGYINLANTLKTLDRGPEAQQLLNKAKELEPSNGLVDFSLGTLYLNTELIKLPGMSDMERLKLAREQFVNAQNHWTNSDDIALAKGYIQTTDDAIETLQAMIDAEALFNSSGSDSESSDSGSSGDSYKVD